MAANWHLGDVGSTADFSINASLGHPGSPLPFVTRAGGEGCRCPTAGRSWTSLQQRAAALVAILLSSKVQWLKSVSQKIHVLGDCPLRRKKCKTSSPTLRFCFFWSITITVFLHCFLLSQLETTFGGAISEHKPLPELIIFFRIFTFFSNSCNFSCKSSQLHIPITISV